MAFDSDGNVKMLVAIRQVDLVNNVCAGWNEMSGSVMVRLNILPGGTRVIPSVGEQWIIQRIGDSWALDDKTDFQDPKATISPEEGLTAYGGRGATHIVGSRVDVPSEFYVGGTKYQAGTPAASIPAAALAWDQEMVLNAGALASGYNDLAGGIIVNNPAGVLIDSILFRLGGDPAATIGGSGGISVFYWRGTVTNAEVTQIGGVTALTAHDSILTLSTPFLATHNSVLRAKIALGSATVAVSCHVQWRGRRQ